MGEATVTELTKRLLMDQTTLTRSLALLRRDGLLKSMPKPDRRLQSVRLTAEGVQVLTKALPLWAQVQKEVLRRIGPDIVEALRVGLDRLAT